MPANSPNIDRLRIATPCPISWEQMRGSDQVRFCDHCRLNVYNISALSKLEAQTLITSTEGRICARLYRRADGTILTKDCPVGLRALRLRVSKRVAATFAAIVSVAGAVWSQQSASKPAKTDCIPQTKTTRSTVPANQNNALAGTVVDPAGAGVPSARITITNTDTQETRTILTNDAGKFEFSPIAAGTYSIKIEANGFITYQLTSLDVKSNQMVHVDTILELKTEYLTGVVDINYLVEPTTPGTTTITEPMIRRLPIPQ
ncbi:MAG TPA: carboxypeptidase-like regulatory domain-containing protein [Pyrinomonadaceae bacterium]|jgi:hypothetical protein